MARRLVILPRLPVLDRADLVLTMLDRLGRDG
jgi:hypothetical protein